MTTSLTTSLLQQELTLLLPLLQRLLSAADLQEREDILDQENRVYTYLKAHNEISDLLIDAPLELAVAAKATIAIGQGPCVFALPDGVPFSTNGVLHLLADIANIEKEYATLGGVVGYQVAILRLIDEWEHPQHAAASSSHYLRPPGTDLSQDSVTLRQMVYQGLEALCHTAEIYPIGGAGDRLGLTDVATGEPRPAAILPFLGRSLLEGLVRDLQGREYLYYKAFGSQVVIPVALMTSHEKDNHDHIVELCEQARWFGRRQTDFFFFTQASVPVVTQEGNWVMKHPLEVALKPGGHGVMWHLAAQQGIFDTLIKQGRRWVLVRQINNPVAGNDGGLLAFMGIGYKENKSFGFLSCPRIVNAAEGTLVLVEKNKGGEISSVISNIEYTDFAKQGIDDAPAAPGSPFSRFPSNTNVLFANLKSLLPIIAAHPIPGMLVNMKNKISITQDDGSTREVACGRLESTMQNIADYLFVDKTHTTKVEPLEDLPTFVAYGSRQKTLSSIKKSCLSTSCSDLLETPEGCLYDILSITHELLANHCDMKLPPLKGAEDYLANGPPFFVTYHPALGPLWEIIGQKIRGGRLAEGAEMQLEIAELFMENIDLEGSLLITADSPLGSTDTDGLVTYGNNGGRCFLRNVHIRNGGIDRRTTHHWWRNSFHRHGALQIILHGDAEFYAEDVTFEGNLLLEVPAGHHLVARQIDGALALEMHPHEAPSWSWQYQVNSNYQWVLSRIPYATSAATPLTR